MNSRIIFTGIVIAVIIQRILELRISQRHAAKILAQGGQKHHDNFLPWVKGLQVSWFVVMLLEVWLLNRPLVWGLAAIALLGTLAGQILRYLSMRALGWRWTLPIITLPGAGVVDTGIYRYLRHPNWLGVILEILAVPLIHSAYLSAIVFSIANAFLLAKRVVAEEQALSLSDSHYQSLFADRPRFLGLPTLSTFTVRNTSTHHGSH
ncbi:MAG: isoprenylcysteine carboxyl methyltransferase [Acaryochloris sp. RU_4_1]|nr:isoprenylcysteine carboxyl methyltransferase [Acaryochloris sp. RU_4_1]NJR54277.1 isoprenylcysteine carboxyl methyltransferase [Acaryochloris sp. CRU_2_0]